MEFAESLTGVNFLLAGAVFVITQVLKTAVPWFVDSPLGLRLTPVVPIVLGVTGALVGLCSSPRWQEQIAIGMLAGFSAGHVFKLGKTTMLGRGIESRGDEKK